MSSNLKILLIGTSSFPNEPELQNILNVESNLEVLRSSFSSKEISAYENTEITTKKNSGFQETLKAITDLSKRADENDTILIYYSGHGVINEDNFELYLSTPETNFNYLDATGINVNTLKSLIGNSFAKRKVIILDCCYSGKVHGTLSSLDTQIAAKIQENKGVFILSSSDKFTPSIYDIEKPKSPTTFTHILCQILTKGIKKREFYITTGLLYKEIHNELSKIAGAPEPKQSGLDFSGDISLVKNLKYSQLPAINNIDLKREETVVYSKKVTEKLTITGEKILSGSIVIDENAELIINDAALSIEEQENSKKSEILAITVKGKLTIRNSKIFFNSIDTKKFGVINLTKKGKVVIEDNSKIERIIIRSKGKSPSGSEVIFKDSSFLNSTIKFDNRHLTLQNCQIINTETVVIGALGSLKVIDSSIRSEEISKNSWELIRKNIFSCYNLNSIFMQGISIENTHAPGVEFLNVNSESDRFEIRTNDSLDRIPPVTNIQLLDFKIINSSFNRFLSFNVIHIILNIQNIYFENCPISKSIVFDSRDDEFIDFSDLVYFLPSSKFNKLAQLNEATEELKNSDLAIIENLVVKNCKGKDDKENYLINLKRLRKIEVNNCHFEDIDNGAIFIKTVPDVKISNSHFIQCNNRGSGLSKDDFVGGIKLKYSNSTLENNVFTNCRPKATSGVGKIKQNIVSGLFKTISTISFEYFSYLDKEERKKLN